MSEVPLQRLEPKKRVGLIVVLTGHGKGKTTSALGMALRAAGHNMKVCIIQFMKGDMYSGEIDGVKKLAPHIELHLTGKGFCGIYGVILLRNTEQMLRRPMKLAKEKMLSGNFDMLILDEIKTIVGDQAYTTFDTFGDILYDVDTTYGAGGAFGGTERVVYTYDSLGNILNASRQHL